MKTCNACLISKPFADFYRHGKSADGHLPRCKDCHKEAMRALYFDKMKDEGWRERELARHRVKAQKARDEGRAASVEITRKGKTAWYRRNKEKKYAHGVVAHAINSGKLIRRHCEICGSLDSEAHHEDYSKPLDVRWLCVRHHADRHLEINRERRAEKYKQVI